MKVFVQQSHKGKGIDRFLESFSVSDCEITYLDDIAEANDHQCDVGIFGGWLPDQLEKVKAVKKKYYVFCSPFGQADLSSPNFYSSEIAILLCLLKSIDEGKIYRAITQSRSLAWRCGFTYIPPVKVNINKYINWNRDRRNYGFMGHNLRKHKNVANQLAAISTLDPQESIIVSDSAPYVHWESMFDCNIISKKTTSDEDYYKEISSHRLCFQCSWSEAFDYQAFEYALMGVPVIGSHCLDWLYKISPKCIVNNIDSCYDIRNVAHNILDNPKEYWNISGKLYIDAQKMNESNIEDLKQVLLEME